MRKVLGALLCLGVAGVALTLVSTVQSRQQDEQKSVTARSPKLYFLDRMDRTTIPLRDMPRIAPQPGRREMSPARRLRPTRPVSPQFVDPLVSRSSIVGGPRVGTTAGLNFLGVGNGLPGFSVSSAPPDTNGAIGATQYVQWVNTAFAVFNKSTGAVVMSPASGNTLWQGFGGPCEANNDGDPIASYDKKANRWVLSQFSVSGGQFWQCIAVSTSPDATGTYRRFSFQFANFNDYPKFGSWPDGYYFTFNMFNAAGTAFLGGRLCVVDRNQMITASGTPGATQCFQLSSSFGGVLPSDQDGATNPPAGSPNYHLAFGANVLQLWKFHTDWATPSNSTLTGPTNIPVAAFTEACGASGTCIPQPSTTQTLDSLSDRLMYRLAYRNFGDHESLVVNHSVTAGSTASGVRWYEVRNPGGTPSVFQQGTFSPDATSRWMGSIAMDKVGNIAMGYSASSSAVRPSIRMTGRVPGDALGTMQAENTITAGVGSQTGGLSRWGDYSALTLDPVDDCTFWFTTEYLQASGSFNWSTRIASFKFPSCGTPTPDFSVSASPSSVSVAQGGTASSTITVGSSNGFNSAVGLTASGLPSGVTASFAPSSVTPPANGSATSTLTFTASGTAATGTFNVTVTGTSGSTTHTTAISLTVSPVVTPNYSVSVSPASLTINRGASGTSTVTVASTGGFNSAVSLSASGLPSGVTASFAPASVTPPANGSATSTLTLAASATATTGTATVTVTGTSGANTRTATLSLTVNAGGQVTVFSDGAESATTTLTFTNANAGTQWTRNTTSPFAGSFRWRLGSATGGNYANNGVATMTTPVLNLSGATTATLTYAYKYHTEATFDFFQVRLSTNGGTTWTNLVNVSGASPAWSGYSTNSINLNSFAGQTNVRIQFRFTSDVSITDFGAAVDEIKVVKQ